MAQVKVWPAVIGAVRSPLGLFALAFLVVQTILPFLARKASGGDFTIIVAGSILIMLVAISAAAFLTVRSAHVIQVPGTIEPREPRKVHAQIRYDVFISSPMEAFKTDAQYAADREHVLTIIQALKTRCQLPRVAYAGEEISSRKHFEPEALSVERDIANIAASEYFLLFYPRKLRSSVLFEAGAALAFGKKCVYFVRSQADLPFLMRHAAEAFTNVRVYQYETGDEIIRLLCDLKVLQWKEPRSLGSRSSGTDAAAQAPE